MRDDELASGLRAAFGDTAPDESVLAALDARPLRLRGTDVEAAESRTGRYQLVGELARGGVGVVHKGRDVDLGRDVAMKVLRPEHADNADVVARFVEEAQIGGQLQHPGIVPVYELGLDEEERPYFSMKLVKGTTLAAMLTEHREDDRRRFLEIFEQVCQTVAYAHARGVVHRDLKPANIMVGAFGEVQVVDWGFAKVIARGGIADERLARGRDMSEIATVRSGSEGSHSVAGSVMGTPAYMPPEQALGQVDALDERSDVFALGVILFEILTGRPPYTGDNRLVLAAQCRIDFAPLDDADRDLAALARSCLAAVQPERPRDAGEVARAVGAHLAATEERAQRARIEAAEARVRADGERRKRRLTLAIAAVLLGALLAGGGTWWKLDRDKRARAATAERAARTADEEARLAAGRDDYAAALAAVRRALQIRATDRRAARRAELQKEADRAWAEKERARKDGALLAALDHIRAQKGDDLDRERADADYVAAFAAYDVDPVTAPDAAAARLRERGDGFARRAAAGLDHWAWVRRVALRMEERPWKPLVQAARRADPDRWRDRLRDAVADQDRAPLRALAASATLPALAAPTLHLLGATLREVGLREEAAAVLRTAQRRYPGDVEINWLLATCVTGDEAVRFLGAALALRPDSVELRHHLGIALADAGDTAAAIRIWRDALARRPAYGHMLAHIGAARFVQGDDEGGERAFREALAMDPGDARTHRMLGRALYDRDRARAVAALRESLRIDPWNVTAIHYVAWAIATSDDPALRDPAEGVRLARALVQRVPYEGGYWRALGAALYRTNDIAGARDAMVKATELTGGGDVWEWLYLAMARHRLGQHDAARELYDRAGGRLARAGTVPPGILRLRDEARALLGR